VSAPLPPSRAARRARRTFSATTSEGAPRSRARSCNLAPARHLHYLLLLWRRRRRSGRLPAFNNKTRSDAATTVAARKFMDVWRPFSPKAAPWDSVATFLLVALALAAAPSGLAMGPFVPDTPTWACKEEDICGRAEDCKICESCTAPGWDCYRIPLITCGTETYMSCGQPGNCLGVEAHGDTVIGGVWAQSCCSSAPGLVTCPEES